MLRSGQGAVRQIASASLHVVSIRRAGECDESRLRYLSPPYNYGLPAAAPGNLFGPELTGCSMTPDNRQGADGCELAKRRRFFACYEYLARVRQFANCAELKTWPSICRCRSWWSTTTTP